MKRSIIILVGLLALVAALSASSSAAPITTTINASDKAPYYSNESVNVDNESWMAGNHRPTLENTTNFLTRIGSFVVGTQPGSSSDEAAGALIVGLLFMGMVLGAIGPNDIGFVAGSVAGTVTIAGLVVGGFAPGWLWPVVLFIAGVGAFVAYLRVYR